MKSGLIRWILRYCARKLILPGVIFLTAAVILISNFSCVLRAIAKRIAYTYPGCIFDIETSQPLLALTIDDGPDAATTPQILTVLKRFQARATFFVLTEQVVQNKNLVRQMIQAGHEIGNHLTQDETSIGLPLEEFQQKFFAADSVLGEFAAIRWFRPGGGLYNASMLDIVEARQYQCVLGTLYPLDTGIPWAWFTKQYILQNVYPGAIIILHDRGARGQRTARVLEDILPRLQQRGYRVVTLSDLLLMEKIVTD
ncbi:MAG: polysaccharide deacetylase family protein [bacterium]